MQCNQRVDLAVTTPFTWWTPSWSWDICAIVYSWPFIVTRTLHGFWLTQWWNLWSRDNLSINGSCIRMLLNKFTSEPFNAVMIFYCCDDEGLVVDDASMWTDCLFSADPNSPASLCQCDTGLAHYSECLHANLAIFSFQKEWEQGFCWSRYYYFQDLAKSQIYA